jgi:hypothetical protein
MFVCHRCDVPSCVNPAHLFAGTASDNMADMHSKGRGIRGEASGNAKLTAAQILDIRNAAEHPRLLAERFGVTQAHIHRVRNGTTWSWLR